MKEQDIVLSKEAIVEKYPKGSPDYPTHCRECVCSGCNDSWLEWRAAHAVYELGFNAGRERAIRWAARYVESVGGSPDALIEAVQADPTAARHE